MNLRLIQLKAILRWLFFVFCVPVAVSFPAARAAMRTPTPTHGLINHNVSDIASAASHGTPMNSVDTMQATGNVFSDEDGSISTDSSALSTFASNNLTDTVPYTLTDLGTLGGSVSQAIAINDAGQVLGSSTTASGALRAFVWEGG